MTVSQLGRTKLVTWPDLNDPSGASQVNTIQAAVEELSNNSNSRVVEFAAQADSATVEVDHNLGLNLDQLSVFILSGSHPSYTRINNPEGIAAPWGIAEKSGSEKLILEITAPASGGPHTFAVVVLQDMDKDHQSARDLLSVSSNITLQNKVLHLVDTGAARSLTLPAPDTQLYVAIKDVTATASSNNITIETPGAETIDGETNFVMDNDSQSAAIISDGTNYFVVTGNGAGGGGLEIVFGSANPGVLENGTHYRFTDAVSAATMPEIIEDGQVIAISPSEGAEWSANAITITPHSGQAIDEDGGSVDDEDYILNLSGVDKITFTSKLSTLNWEVDTPITPTTIGNGAYVGNWESYTPSTISNFPTGKTIKFFKRRTSDSLDIRLEIPSGGSAGAPSQMLFSLPDNHTADSSLIDIGAGNASNVGNCIYNDGAHDRHGFGRLNSATNISLFKGLDGTDAPLNGTTVDTRAFSYEACGIPIAEFANSGTTLTASDFSAKTKWVDNGVLQVTETSSNGLSISEAKGRCHRDSTGTYSFEFQVRGTKTFNGSGVSFSMNGITTAFDQGVVGVPYSQARFLASSDVVNTGLVDATEVSTGEVWVSGNIILDSKPSWFDDNAENNYNIDVHFQEATSSKLGLVKKPAYQNVQLAASTGTGTFTPAEWQFNLVQGRTYRLQIHGYCRLDINGGAGSVTLKLETQTGVDIARLWRFTNVAGTAIDMAMASQAYYFTPSSADEAASRIEIFTNNDCFVFGGVATSSSYLEIVDVTDSHEETTF